MRNRPCCTGHRQLLVLCRTADYFNTHTDRRTWCCNGCRIHFYAFRQKISLMQRSTMQNAISAPTIGGIVRLTKFILKGTFIIEFLGALLMMPVFIHDFGINGLWMSVFHSISAFVTRI